MFESNPGAFSLFGENAAITLGCNPKQPGSELNMPCILDCRRKKNCRCELLNWPVRCNLNQGQSCDCGYLDHRTKRKINTRCDTLGKDLFTLFHLQISDQWKKEFYKAAYGISGTWLMPLKTQQLFRADALIMEVWMLLIESTHSEQYTNKGLHPDPSTCCLNKTRLPVQWLWWHNSWVCKHEADGFTAGQTRAGGREYN